MITPQTGVLVHIHRTVEAEIPPHHEVQAVSSANQKGHKQAFQGIDGVASLVDRCRNVDIHQFTLFIPVDGVE